MSGTLIVVRLKNTGCSTGPLFPRREGSGSVGNSGAERRARGSDPNRCPALAPAAGSHAFPGLHVRAGHRGWLEVADGREGPFLFLP